MFHYLRSPLPDQDGFCSSFVSAGRLNQPHPPLGKDDRLSSKAQSQRAGVTIVPYLGAAVVSRVEENMRQIELTKQELE